MGFVRRVYCYELRSFLEVPEKVERIVSLTPSVTATLIELGLRERIVGISLWCRSLRSFGIDIPDVPVVGSYTDIRYEVMKSLEPDLVLLAGGYQVKLVDRLHELGIPYFVTRLPRGLEVLDLPIEIGYAINVVDKGLEVAKKCLECFWRAREIVLANDTKLKVLAVMKIGSDVVLPGIASHVAQTLGVVGLSCLNTMVSGSYIWGLEALKKLKELCRKADVVLYQVPKLAPEILEDEVVTACKEQSIAFLPTLSLSDYSPSYMRRLTKLINIVFELGKERSCRKVVSAKELAA